MFKTTKALNKQNTHYPAISLRSDRDLHPWEFRTSAPLHSARQHATVAPVILNHEPHSVKPLPEDSYIASDHN